MASAGKGLDLEGQYWLPATPEQTWRQLTRPEVLQFCIKGCDQVELGQDGVYIASFAFGIGPLKKTVQAQLRVTELTPPAEYILDASLETRRMGQAGGRANVTLAVERHGCMLQYAAEVVVSGWFDRFAEPVLQAAAGRVMKVFFERFAELLDHDPEKP